MRQITGTGRGSAPAEAKSDEVKAGDAVGPDTGAPDATEDVGARIDEHPILDEGQRVMARAYAQRARLAGMSPSLLEFSRVALRATGRAHASAIWRGDSQEELAAVEAAHCRAAILHAYEAVMSDPDMRGGEATLADLEAAWRRLAPPWARTARAPGSDA